MPGRLDVSLDPFLDVLDVFLAVLEVFLEMTLVAVDVGDLGRFAFFDGHCPLIFFCW
jgi:hypothetical protein